MILASYKTGRMLKIKGSKFDAILEEIIKRGYGNLHFYEALKRCSDVDGVQQILNITEPDDRLAMI